MSDIYTKYLSDLMRDLDLDEEYGSSAVTPEQLDYEHALRRTHPLYPERDREVGPVRLRGWRYYWSRPEALTGDTEE